MSNISDYRFVLYERLASQKLNEILSQLNSHNHGSAGGVSVDVNLAFSNYSIPGSKIALNSISGSHIIDGTITGSDIAAGAIAANNIANSCITTSQLDLTDIHLVDGYAVYAP